MQDSFKSQVDQAQSLLILLPQTAEFDDVAAGLSLFLALGQKNVSIASPIPMRVEFNRLVGVNKITTELGNKNLVISFAGYPAKNIEKVSYDVESDQFKLTVIPKEGFESPTKEQVQLARSGASADTIVLIGGTNENHFPALASKETQGVKLIHVGTRDINLGNRQVISLAQPGSSVSEVVYRLLKENGYQIDNDVATNLLMGIEEGSKTFSNPEVNADTFAAASELMRAGGRRVPKQEPRQYPAGAIPGQMPRRTMPLAPSQQGSAQSKPAGQTSQTPQSWLEPKIYKGTNVS